MLKSVDNNSHYRIISANESQVSSYLCIKKTQFKTNILNNFPELSFMNTIRYMYFPNNETCLK